MDPGHNTKHIRRLENLLGT